MVQPFPGSLPEGAGSPQGLTEGVSSDGCSVPTIHTPAHINSEIFERLRASKYTPSVSHSLDSSLREGAGKGGNHSTGYLLKSRVAGDFHRPYENSEVGTFHHSTGDTPSVSHSLDSSLREGAGNGCGGGYHSTGYLLKSRVAGDFHRPYEARIILPGIVQPTARKRRCFGRWFVLDILNA